MQNAKILIADDSCAVRLCLQRTLHAAGYDVFVACDGIEAIRVAREVDLDLAILDIQMPEVDGYAACEQILRDGPMPIIFLTREVAPHLNALGDQLGAYLPKPADEKTLLKTVRNLLNRVATHTC